MSTRNFGLATALCVATIAPAAATLTAGCMQTTVKASERRVLSAEEAAAAKKLRQEKEGEKKPAGPPAPTPPQTLEQEIERLRGLVEKEPQQPKWHYLLGMAYEEQGRLELAELRYRRGGELIPKGQYTGPHYFLGRVLAKEGKWTPALAELEKAVAVKPPDVEGYYLNPDYRESYYLVGAIQHRLRNLAESEKALKLFLKYGGERHRVVEFFPELITE